MAASSVNNKWIARPFCALVRGGNESIMVFDMKKISAFFIFLVLASSAFAQVRTFKWSSEMCDFTGTYDSKKYSAVELENTRRLFSYDLNLTYHPSVFKYEDIAKIDLTELEKDYAAKSAELKTMKIVKFPFWETVRQNKLKELEQTYRHRKAISLAYTNPKVLREYTAAPACNAKYVEPLIAGGESFYKVWLDVNMESRSKNSDPARLKREFEVQMASPDRAKYALVEVMGFGWGNCSNEFIEYDEGASDGTYLKEFKKLFTRVRESCEEP